MGGLGYLLKLEPQSPERAQGITTEKTVSPYAFRVYNDGEYMFWYSVASNGFGLKVEEEKLMAPELYFSKHYQYSDGMMYSLTTSRELEDGRLKVVNYDMASGDKETTIFFDGDEMSAYDSEGNLIDTNRLDEADGVIRPTRKSLETLRGRTEELSEKLRNYTPEPNEQN